MKSYTHWETAEDTKLFVIIPFRKKASPTLLIFCKQNPIHRTLVQRQSTGNLDLNNERKKRWWLILRGTHKNLSWRHSVESQRSRLAKVTASSGVCILMGVNKALYDRFDCSYRGGVQETQSKKAGGNNSGLWKKNLVAEDKGFYSAFPW